MILLWRKNLEKNPSSILRSVIESAGWPVTPKRRRWINCSFWGANAVFLFFYVRRNKPYDTVKRAEICSHLVVIRRSVSAATGAHYRTTFSAGLSRWSFTAAYLFTSQRYDVSKDVDFHWRMATMKATPLVGLMILVAAGRSSSFRSKIESPNSDCQTQTLTADVRPNFAKQRTNWLIKYSAGTRNSWDCCRRKKRVPKRTRKRAANRSASLPFNTQKPRRLPELMD